MEVHLLTSILTYLIVASVVLFFEVIFPFGILGLASLGLYAIAVFKGWAFMGAVGAITTFILSIIFAAVTAYWELRVLPRRGLAKMLRDRIEARTIPEGEVSIDLKGQEGVAMDELNPTGRVEIKSKSYDAESVGGKIAEGAKIKVVDIGVTGVKVASI